MQEDGTARGCLEVALDPVVNKTGDVWHCSIEGLKDLGTLCYGWRADADISWDAGNRFHPGSTAPSTAPQPLLEPLHASSLSPSSGLLCLSIVHLAAMQHTDNSCMLSGI